MYCSEGGGRLRCERAQAPSPSPSAFPSPFSSSSLRAPAVRQPPTRANLATHKSSQTRNQLADPPAKAAPTPVVSRQLPPGPECGRSARHDAWGVVGDDIVMADTRCCIAARVYPRRPFSLRPPDVATVGSKPGAVPISKTMYTALLSLNLLYAGRARLVSVSVSVSVNRLGRPRPRQRWWGRMDLAPEADTLCATHGGKTTTSPLACTRRETPASRALVRSSREQHFK